MKISGGMALGLPEYLVYGSKGALEIGQGKVKIKYIDPVCNLPPPVANPGTPYPSFGSTGTFSQKEVIQWVEETFDSPQDDLTVIWDYLYDSYLNGKAFPITLEESAVVMKVITDAKSK